MPYVSRKIHKRHAVASSVRLRAVIASLPTATACTRLVELPEIGDALESSSSFDKISIFGEDCFQRQLTGSVKNNIEMNRATLQSSSSETKQYSEKN